MIVHVADGASTAQVAAALIAEHGADRVAVRTDGPMPCFEVPDPQPEREPASEPVKSPRRRKAPSS